MKKRVIITALVILFIMFMILTAAVIYRINYKKQIYDYNEELYVSNEIYDIIVYPPIDREYSAHEYSAYCEIRNDILYGDIEISHEEYLTKLNETICQIINDVYSYIADNNINEKFRIYIKTALYKDKYEYTFEFYNYCDIFKYYRGIDDVDKEKFSTEMESVGINSNFISCFYHVDMFENTTSQKYAIELLKNLKIKYLMVGYTATGTLDITGLDRSDFEKLKPVTVLVASHFIVSEDIYKIVEEIGMITNFNEELYTIDCSERDDLNWYFNGGMFVKDK